MTSQILLLLVEDEALILMIAQEALEEGGYTVLTAADGNEAMALLDDRHEQILGLVTDIRLGGSPDGWELARHARSLNHHVPVVYATADSASDWPEKGVPKSLVVQKPYAGAQLVTAISTLLTQADTDTVS